MNGSYTCHEYARLTEGRLMFVSGKMQKNVSNLQPFSLFFFLSKFESLSGSVFGTPKCHSRTRTEVRSTSTLSSPAVIRSSVFWYHIIRLPRSVARMSHARKFYIGFNRADRGPADWSERSGALSIPVAYTMCQHWRQEAVIVMIFLDILTARQHSWLCLALYQL